MTDRGDEFGPFKDTPENKSVFMDAMEQIWNVMSQKATGASGSGGAAIVVTKPGGEPAGWGVALTSSQDEFAKLAALMNMNHPRDDEDDLESVGEGGYLSTDQHLSDHRHHYERLVKFAYEESEATVSMQMSAGTVTVLTNAAPVVRLLKVLFPPQECDDVEIAIQPDDDQGFRQN